MTRRSSAALPALPPREPVGLPLTGPGAPLRITATVAGRIALPHGPLALDGLLAAAVCMIEGVVPATRLEDCRPVEIPVQREPDGRFHLASFSVGAFERFGTKWINRRFPIAEAQAMGGPKLRRINLAGGPCKSYRIPLESGHLVDDTLTWFCLGDRVRIEALLPAIRGLGKRRGVGLGRVLRWQVEPCESWGPSFPVVSPEGRPLRTLPLDWPGLAPDVEAGYKTLTFPYWARQLERLHAVPDTEPRFA